MVDHFQAFPIRVQLRKQPLVEFGLVGTLLWKRPCGAAHALSEESSYTATNIAPMNVTLEYFISFPITASIRGVGSFRDVH